VHVPSLQPTLETSLLQASYTAEEVAQDRGHGKALRVVDEAKLQRLQELETLLAEYKSTNDKLSEELDALGGPLSRRGRTWEELVEDIERERASRFSLQQGKTKHLPFSAASNRSQWRSPRNSQYRGIYTS
jgi:hypothetical protein